MQPPPPPWEFLRRSNELRPEISQDHDPHITPQTQRILPEVLYHRSSSCAVLCCCSLRYTTVMHTSQQPAATPPHKLPQLRLPASIARPQKNVEPKGHSALTSTCLTSNSGGEPLYHSIVVAAKTQEAGVAIRESGQGKKRCRGLERPQQRSAAIVQYSILLCIVPQNTHAKVINSYQSVPKYKPDLK